MVDDASVAEAGWEELLARTVAHLAAQLTIMQIRFRALATELADRGLVDESAVMAQAGAIAQTEAGRYLRENLGEALTELIDVEALEADLIAYLSANPEPGAPGTWPQTAP